MSSIHLLPASLRDSGENQQSGFASKDFPSSFDPAEAWQAEGHLPVNNIRPNTFAPTRNLSISTCQIVER